MVEAVFGLPLIVHAQADLKDVLWRGRLGMFTADVTEIRRGIH